MVYHQRSCASLYIISRQAVYHQSFSERLYKNAFAMMICKAYALMICNSCGIDDIHGYAVILRLSSKPYYKTQKYLFCSLST